ncbi:MAG TPA: transketolase, partial [Solirubrobacteraceae bacterium]|nr:transketolase [Solirubrobacteraceae bacterium]
MTASSTTTNIDQLCIDTIRTLSMDAVQKANSGHPGAPMGLAPVAYTLYTRVMRHNPGNPSWIDRDRFVLSAGHASMLLYSTLFLTGYPMTLDDIEHFRQVGWPTAGHPERWDSPGIEATTGPLGQGISMSVGLALGERMLAARFNRDGHDVVDHFTFTIASDGDMQEGVASEASSLAGHLGLGRLIAFYDNNKIQLAGPTSQSFTEDVAKRYEAYEWHVQNVGEDLSVERLEEATRTAMAVQDRPSLIIVRSHIGYGSPHKQDSSAAHGSALGEDEVRLTKEVYGWDPDKHFYVPDEALTHFRRCCQRGSDLESEWQQRFDAYREAFPAEAEELEMIYAGRLPDGWETGLPRFSADDKPVATRKASGDVIQWAAKAIPQLVGGSADLSTSNDTDIDGAGDVERGTYGGRNLRFGVREHAMGAIVNGLALQGFRSYGGTFLTFSDYMRGAVRLSALMGLPCVWVWTHDSIGLGEDGPTHQPIEQLAALRAMPRLNVLRPADANETALGWRFALRNGNAPTAFALSRQNLPILDPDAIPDDAIERGAYVLRESGDGGETPDLILIGTGSEVSLCLQAADALASEARVRVVSMPCMDTFAEADDDYRESVLPSACRARIAVEAAVQLGWDRWIGPDGRFVGMHSFGESGPAPQV